MTIATQDQVQRVKDILKGADLLPAGPEIVSPENHGQERRMDLHRYDRSRDDDSVNHRGVQAIQVRSAKHYRFNPGRDASTSLHRGTNVSLNSKQDGTKVLCSALTIRRYYGIIYTVRNVPYRRQQPCQNFNCNFKTTPE